MTPASPRYFYESIADRFEGPVTIEQLRAAADGTLAGRVPAVDVTTAG